MTASIASELSRIGPEVLTLPPQDPSRYTIDGIEPLAVVAPDTREQVSEVLRWAAERGVAVYPRGGGTKTALGNLPDGPGVILELSRLNRVIDYQPGDMTVTVEAGITLGALQQELSEARQFVPLESPMPNRATVGGILATACSGPMAAAYGPPRDSLIGIGVVGADGIATKAGGRVVKNVTGYDLNRLYTGSLGTLAVIVEASFKVSPLQPQAYAMAVSFDSMEEAVAAGRKVLDLPSGPMSFLALAGGLPRSFLESHALESHDFAAAGQGLRRAQEALGICFFSARPVAMGRRVEDTREALMKAGATGAAGVENPEDARQWLADLGWPESSRPALSLRISAPRQNIPALSEACRGVQMAGIPADVMADPGFGVVKLLFLGEAEAQEILAVVAEVRRAARQHDGTAVVEICAHTVKGNLDIWGDEPSSMEIMRRIKEQFDPQRLLNRGRFVGRL